MRLRPTTSRRRPCQPSMLRWPDVDQGVDSSIDRPTPVIAAQAFASGVRMWGGYLTTFTLPASVNLAAAWRSEDWAVIRSAGIGGIAFCSGWDSPILLRERARNLGVLLCLDVENAIRGDGPWVDEFLQASGAGLYGEAGVHSHAAPFHILAAYPSVTPGATWDGQPPPGPHGWQYEGTHTEWGISVDRAFYDEWFYEVTMLLNQGMKIGLAHVAIAAIYNREPTQTEEFDFAGTLNDDGSNYNDLVQGLAAELGNADLAPIQPAALEAQVASLKGASGTAAHHHAGGPTGPVIPG